MTTIPYFELSTGAVVLEALRAGYLVCLTAHQNFILQHPDSRLQNSGARSRPARASRRSEPREKVKLEESLREANAPDSRWCASYLSTRHAHGRKNRRIMAIMSDNRIHADEMMMIEGGETGNGERETHPCSAQSRLAHGARVRKRFCVCVTEVDRERQRVGAEFEQDQFGGHPSCISVAFLRGRPRRRPRLVAPGRL